MANDIKLNDYAVELSESHKAGMEYVIEKIRQHAIKYDEQSFYWFQQWHNEEENSQLYYDLYMEKNNKVYAMIALLDELEPFYTHTVGNGKIYKELIA